jgi:TonB family protein
MNFHQPLRAFGIAILTVLLASYLLGCAESRQQSGDSPVQQGVEPRQGRNFLPSYPAQVARNGWEGTVVLRVLLGNDCRAFSVEVAHSSGHGILDDAAKECVSKWTFRRTRWERTRSRLYLSWQSKASHPLPQRTRRLRLGFN